MVESKGKELTLTENDDRIVVTGCDIDGIARGKHISRSKFDKSQDGDSHDKTYLARPPFFEADGGFSDVLAHIDLSSGRRAPWDHGRPHYLLDFHDANGVPLPFCPRSLLKSVVAKYQTITPLCGMEFEWFQFKETPESLAEKKGVGLTPLTTGMFGYSLQRTQINRDYFNDIYDSCRDFGIPIEGLHTETGPGVYEAAIEYADALSLADRAHLFKYAVKQVSLKYGITPCFMAKPYPDQPGCSGHMHFSLSNTVNGNRVNLFAPVDGETSHPYLPGTSPLLSYFLAGILEGLPSIMAILGPTINSYKRLVENYWAPITISYGLENRTAAIRLIAPPLCPPDAIRLEVRVPGADVNAYLAAAAILACGYHGILTKMELTVPPLVGDVSGPSPAVSLPIKEAKEPKVKDGDKDHGKMTVKGGERLPNSLKEAVRVMNLSDSFARKVLGNAFVDHYVATRNHEVRLWERAVTDWEVFWIQIS